MRQSKIKEQRPVSADRHPQSENEYKGTIVKWIGIFMSCLLVVLGVPLFLVFQKIVGDLSGDVLLTYITKGSFWMTGVLSGVSVTLIVQKAIKTFLSKKQQ